MKPVSDLVKRPLAWTHRGAGLAVVLAGLAAFAVGLPTGGYFFGPPRVTGAKDLEHAIGDRVQLPDPLEGKRYVTAQYEVARAPLALLGAEPPSEHDFNVLRRTQVAFIKSPFVLTTALSDQAIAKCPLLAAQEDPVTWLSENLVAYFPSDGEVMSVALPHPTADGDDLRAIVNAVSKAYYDEVVFRYRSQRVAPLQLLKESAQEISDRIAELQEAVLLREAEDDEPSNEPRSDGRRREIAALIRFEDELTLEIQREQVRLMAPSPIRAIGANRSGGALAEMIDPGEKLPWLPL